MCIRDSVLTVLKEGSFTGAAKKLYVSQPSLSQIIKAAEANLGAPIFNRNTDPITLTPAGALYVKAAKQISTISTNLAKQVEELSNEEFGRIRLGISVQRGMELLPYLYPRFKSRFPHVELELHEQMCIRDRPTTTLQLKSTSTSREARITKSSLLTKAPLLNGLAYSCLLYTSIKR